METQPNYGFVLVMDGKYWNRLCSNKTAKYFVRKGAVAPKRAKKLLFYVTKRMLRYLG
ncbi:MAG: hypothetical protein ACM3UY_11460 [Methanocella sp.]|mgnify:CR=1 FL=1|jgi:hypothetical protein